MLAETLLVVTTYALVVALLVVVPLLVVRGVGGALNGSLDADWRATHVESYALRLGETTDDSEDGPPDFGVERPRPR
ncbi:hypothetical protein [Halomarina rubra]|uniref:Uncharacterized protein n=1 Tax=Halomarina rubra TaxID=2071873 RepID=A0ABD6ASU0_9EURY|nr:hypothetical protein [Halomarina rubra]